VAGDILDDDGRATVDRIRVGGGESEFVHLDVASEIDWRSIIEYSVQRFGKVDIAVNCAGISGSTTSDTLDVEFWHRLMAVNATGVFLGMKYQIPAMQSAGGGSIVNIASIAGNVGQKNLHLGYPASKAAVRVMSKAAAVQFAARGIRVNTVHPGILPPMRSSIFAGDLRPRPEHVSRIPLGRQGEVDEVVNAILFLASSEASYITGSELHVDGGYLAS
jgi:NAD(P)-dependent dehydrogenase (short-subunit alcohol dehydrogenase family)